MYLVIKGEGETFVWDDQKLVMYHYDDVDDIAEPIPPTLEQLLKFRWDLKFVSRRKKPPKPVLDLLKEVGEA